jgi:putative NADH-flavin reductase
MSTIVVLGAGGKAGQLVVAEAARRRHLVRAVVRSLPVESRLRDGVDLVVGDATSKDDLASLLAGTDAVIVTVGAPGRDVYREVARVLTDAVARLPEPRPYIVHMGGGSTLRMPDGSTYLEQPGFPDAYRDPAEGQKTAFEYYRSSAPAGVQWTYFSPPPHHLVAGEATGRYRLGDDEPVNGDDGEARLSYGDLAVVLVDEAETRAHAGRRFTAGY